MADFTKEEVITKIKAGQSLDGADLSNLDLSGSTRTRDTLSSSRQVTPNPRLNLEWSDMQPINQILQSEVIPFRTNLKGALLRRAKLYKANLSWTDLTDANLRGAGLTAGRLPTCMLAGAQFKKPGTSSE